MKLYKDQLMDHYRHPRNRGLLSKSDFSSESLNPSCGDSVSMSGLIHANGMKDLKFEGEGCVISQAAASLLTEHCIGKTLDYIMKLDKDFMLNLVGIPLGPVRLRCALLPLEALHKGILSYQSSEH